MEARFGSEGRPASASELDVIEEALLSLHKQQDIADSLNRIRAGETVWLARQLDTTSKFELISNHQLIGDITIDEELGTVAIDSTYISPALRLQDWRLGEAAQLLINHLPPKAAA